MANKFSPFVSPGIPDPLAATPTSAITPAPEEQGPEFLIPRRRAHKPHVFPVAIDAVIQAESAGDPNAVSPAGAQGLMQLMPGTAADMGVTDSFDPEQNRAGGTKYLQQQLNNFGSWELALMAYNWGPGNVRKWLRKGSKPGAVPKETQNYVNKLLPQILGVQNDQQQQRRDSFTGASATPGDKVVEANKIAKDTGIPVDDVIRDQESLAALTASNKYAQFTSPITQKHLADPAVLAIAHDDVENMGTFENLGAGILERGFDLVGSLTRQVGTTADAAADFLERVVPLGVIEYDFTGAGPVVQWRPSTEADISEESPLLSFARDFETLDLGYRQMTSFEDFKDSPLQNFLPFALEQGIISAPDMVAVMVNLPGYVAARSAELGQERAKNDGRVDATVEDFLAAAPAAVASAVLERVGAKSILGIGTAALKAGGKKAIALGAVVAKATAVGATKEAVTEAGQEFIEFTGERLGTEEGFDLEEGLDRAFAGAVGGLGFGGSLRAGTATIEVIGAASATKKKLDEMNQLSKDSLLRARDKAARVKFEIEAMLGSEEGAVPVEGLTIKATALLEWAKQHVLPTDEALATLELNIEDGPLKEALDADGAVAVGVPFFVGNILGTEGYDLVASDISVAGQQSVNAALAGLQELVPDMASQLEAIQETQREGVSNSVEERAASVLTELTGDKGAEVIDQLPRDVKKLLNQLAATVTQERVTTEKVQIRGRLEELDNVIGAIEAKIVEKSVEVEEATTAGRPTARLEGQLTRLEEQRKAAEEEQAALPEPAGETVLGATSEVLRPAVPPEVVEEEVALEQQLVDLRSLKATEDEALERAERAVTGEPPSTEPAAAFEEGGELDPAKGTGEETRDFFGDITSGRDVKGRLDVEYVPVLTLDGEAAEFDAVRKEHTGKFDDHIETSIPGYGEIQPMVGSAIVAAVPSGRVLDIGGSEGGLSKAIVIQSDGALTAIVLDPNPDMQVTFDKTPVEGASYQLEAFGTNPTQDGAVAFTDEGVDITFFTPDPAGYEVIHESMVFQFIDNNRDAQVERVAGMLTPTGLAIFQQKFLATEADIDQWKANEAQKDEFKRQYFTQEAMDKKVKEVLLGMHRFMVTPQSFEATLRANFTFVAQYWDSGNFKGYVATNDAQMMEDFVAALPDTSSEFEKVETPREVKAGETVALLQPDTAAKTVVGRVKKRRTALNRKIALAEEKLAKSRARFAPKPAPSQRKLSLKAGVLDALEVKTTRAAVRAARKGFREGLAAGQQNVKTVQKAFVQVVKASGLTGKVREKHLRSIPNTTTIKQLEKKRTQILVDLERQRKRQLRSAIKTVLARAVKAKGTMTPTVQTIVNSLSKIASFSKGDAMAELDRRDGGIAKTPGPKERMENTLLAAIARPDTALTADLENILFEVFNEITEGKQIRTAGLLIKVLREDQTRARLLEAIGPESETPLTGFLEKVVNIEAAGLSLNGAWATKLRRVFASPNTELVEGVLEAVRLFDEARAFEQGKIDTTARLVELMQERFTGLSESKIFKMMYDSMTEEVQVGAGQRYTHAAFEGEVGVSKPITMSRAELRQRVMEMRNDKLNALARAPNGNAYTDEIIAALGAELTADDVKMIDAQQQFYNEYYERINKVYERIYGYSLPKVENYVPIQRERTSAEDPVDEFLQNIHFTGNLNPSAIQERQASVRPLVAANDVSRLQSHMMQMEYFIAFAEKVQFLNSVFGGDNSAVAGRIRANYGSTMLSGILKDLEYFANRGILSSITGEKTWVGLLRNYSFAQLGLKPQIGLKQLVSSVAYVENVSTVDFMAGVAKFLVNPKKALRFLNEHSQFFRNRGVNIDQDFSDMTRDVNTFLGKRPTLTKWIMVFIRWGDRGAIAIGGFAHIQAAMKAGKTQEQAFRSFERISVDTQQSQDPDQVSELQRTNALTRVMSQFMSSANALARAEYVAIVEFARGRITRKELAKRFIVLHFLIPSMIQYITNGFNWEDDDQLRAVILGAFNGVFVAGDAAEYLVGMILGSPDVFDLEIRHPLEFFTDLGKAIASFEEDDYSLEDFFEGINSLDRALRATGAVTGIPLGTFYNQIRGFGLAAEGDVVGGGALMLGWSPYIVDKFDIGG